jgi:hypothetical protein
MLHGFLCKTMQGSKNMCKTTRKTCDKQYSIYPCHDRQAQQIIEMGQNGFFPPPSTYKLPLYMSRLCTLHDPSRFGYFMIAVLYLLYFALSNKKTWHKSLFPTCLIFSYHYGEFFCECTLLLNHRGGSQIHSYPKFTSPTYCASY